MADRPPAEELFCAFCTIASHARKRERLLFAFIYFSQFIYANSLYMSRRQIGAIIHICSPALTSGRRTSASDASLIFATESRTAPHIWLLLCFLRQHITTSTSQSHLIRRKSIADAIRQR